MLSFFSQDVLGEILNLIESISEGFPSYSLLSKRDVKALEIFYTTKIEIVFRL